MPDVFITGTDTGIGKTLVSTALVRGLRARGVRAVGMKPVASGCTVVGGVRVNEDVEWLLGACAPDAPPRALVNPYAFEAAIAPHLAAAREGVEITLAPIRHAYRALATTADRIVVEGVGGWSVPLSPTLMQADLVHALDLPVLLVVGLRLGCLNHALSSARAIEADGCRLLGWVANAIDPDMVEADANVETLRLRIPAPLLGRLPTLPDGMAVTLAGDRLATALERLAGP